MLNEILDNLKIGVAIVDKDFHLKFLNKYLRELLVDEETDFEKIQNRFGNIFNCRNIGIDLICGSNESCKTCDITSVLKNVYENQDGIIFDLEIFSDRFKIKRDGRFELKGYPIYIGAEKLIQLEIHEVTEKKILEKSLQIKEKSQKKLQIFLDRIEDFIFYLNRDEKIEYCNNSYLKFLGKTYEEVIGKTESDLVPKAMAEKCKKNTTIALEEGTFFEEENIFGKWYQTFKGKIELEDGSVGILGVVRDITAQKNREKQLNEKAYVDILTGIFNRNYFEEKISGNMEFQGVSAIVIDIDDFKEVNDTRGHETGDQVLKSVADIIKINIRKEDYAVRMGGDEFLVLTHSDSLGLEKIADRILNSARNIKIGNISVSLSIGVGINRSGEKELSRIIKDADEALYYSKHSGKNTVSFK
ncbi:MAG: sensor domain-containing diguanylate cyclase [Fusobacteriaceae bacterium]